MVGRTPVNRLEVDHFILILPVRGEGLDRGRLGGTVGRLGKELLTWCDLS